MIESTDRSRREHEGTESRKDDQLNLLALSSGSGTAKEKIADTKITSPLPHQTIEFDSPYASWIQQHLTAGPLKDAEEKPELFHAPIKVIHESNELIREPNNVIHEPNEVIRKPNNVIHEPNLVIREPHARVFDPEPLVKGLNLPEPPDIFTKHVNIPEEPLVKGLGHIPIPNI